MIRRFFFPILFAFFSVMTKAQIKVDFNPQKSQTEGCIRVTSVRNNSEFDVDVYFKNQKDGKEQQRRIKAKESLRDDITCTSIRATSVDKKNSNTLWSEEQTKKMWAKSEKEEMPLETPVKEKPMISEGSRNNVKSVADIAIPKLSKSKKNLKSEQIVKKFNEYLNMITFLSENGITTSKSQVDKYIKDLENWEDIDSCIAENDLKEFVGLYRDSLDSYKSEAQTLVYRFSRQFNVDEATNVEISRMINDRIERRENELIRLENAMTMKKEEKKSSISESVWKIIVNCASICIVILFIVFWIVRVGRKKGKKTAQVFSQSPTATPGIVVRRTTTSILKKQSLEDVIDNPAYLKIDSVDFCSDSAVRRLYLKNSCVKDIYNMYAEDLRNPDNPKEDGCMVLGRWVFDKDTNEYYVSLEQIVRPGDDAVLEEYELNFGGKIKLRVAERLRKLRRETNLQYDMTCWIHSHPGLGVFFSNADNSAHMQLKHPTHPLFLTAIVVDILTPEQELGIFTFKKDGTVNAKADLTKMYSLEKMYKWAVESERNTFKEEGHYNSLGKASKHYYDCAEVQLSNGAIIDIEMLATEQENGTMAFVHGFRNRQGSKIRYIANTVSKQEKVLDNELIGCFVKTTYCSIPSIRKTLANHSKAINFVLIATSSDGMLTTIPVLNGELCNDTNYYSEEFIEDLKIWTRRKR